ncbi:COP9 signalosome complex subunit 12 [Trichophyton equinum CBS 127.97]|uniref:Protein CSN12 homolog n=1 Tax=Trichophyton equinum (strain ATCC MYA-4606 / CBS 127.97) TaxID=559882 RepID=F2PY50_TRIEC|nr:COP9 signalosome complex subunit 12 [Trichophyton equinum CBS 127.97]
MTSLFAEFKKAQSAGSGEALAATLNPVDIPRLRAFYNTTNSLSVASDIRYGLLQDRVTGTKLPKQEGNVWVDIYIAFWKAAGELVKLDDPKFTLSGRGTWTALFGHWKDIAVLLNTNYSNSTLDAWTLPVLYVVGKYLRIFAIKADAEAAQDPASTFNDGFQDDIVGDVSKNAKLEETSRIISRMYTVCLHDRAPIEESRKWGVYNTINLAFKTYFKLGSIPPCRNLLSAMKASQAELPPMESFPKSHIVTFKYYLGVICFLEEGYVEAEEHLTAAWELCRVDSHRNRELILTYLIPCHIVNTNTLPSARLLSRYPRIESLFGPLSKCIRKGDLAGVDAAMAGSENEFVKRRIYLPIERGRDLAIRNLFRKVFIAGGYDPPVNGQPPIRRTRVPVKEFAAAMRLGTGNTEQKSKVDLDEVECYLSNMIYKNLMKGYIARERGIVVLSKGGTAFPGTGV